MKKLILALFLSSFYLNGFCATLTIVNSSYTFSPDSITIQEGDNVSFVLESVHNAVEVSQTVWNANGNSPVIGFSVPYGGGTVSATQLTVGTHYFVCSPHAFMGMKGRIIVQAASGLSDTENKTEILVYPNPVYDHFYVQFDFPESTKLEMKLFDIQGRLVHVLYPESNVNGTFLQSFQLGNKMAPGVYLVKITYGERIRFKSIIVL